MILGAFSYPTAFSFVTISPPTRPRAHAQRELICQALGWDARSVPRRMQTMCHIHPQLIDSPALPEPAVLHWWGEYRL